MTAIETGATAVPFEPRLTLSARQRLILVVLLGAGFMGSVDFSILNVALPLAGAGVGMGARALPWIQSAIALPAAGFTLLFGRLGDLFGRRRIFLLGIVLLAVGSVIGGLATSPQALLTARVLQGFAAALTAPAAMSLLTTSFAEGAVRDRVLGLNGALLSGGFSVGALLGGSLVSLIGWRGAFWINVPVSLLILALAPLVISESRRPGRNRLDLPGAVSVTGGLVAVVYGVSDGSVLAALVGALLLGSFWLVETRVNDPLVPLHMLRRASVRWGNVAGFVTFLVEPAMIFLITLYLENILGLSPLSAGLVLGVPGLVSVAAGPLAGRLIARHGTVMILPIGLAVQGLAIVPLAFVGAGRASLCIIVPALMIGFLGHVSAIVAYNVAATSGLPDDEQGLAAGLATMTGTVGRTIGIPVLSVLAAISPGLAGDRLALLAAALLAVATAAGVVRALHGTSGRDRAHD